jgi:hypothetical protein
MNDYSAKFGDRHMVTGWASSPVVEVQGFYCPNGPDVDGEWNVVMPDGKVGPGPASRYPAYFFPELGSSYDRGVGHHLPSILH